MEHLEVAVLHQGSPETAAPPVVRAVGALLVDGRAHPDVVDGLIEFLGYAGRCVLYSAELGEAVAEVYAAIQPMLEWGLPFPLADSLVAMACTPLLAAQRAELAAAIRRQAAEFPPGPLAAPGAADWVRLLAELGEDVRDRLDDPDPAVRLRAALATEDEPAARRIILAALATPPPRGVHVSELVGAAIRVAGSFAEISEAACAVVARARWTGFGDDWGPLVAFAFLRPYRGRLDDAQRELVRALVANDDLWDPANGSVGLVYRRAGLPYDRNACRSALTAT